MARIGWINCDGETGCGNPDVSVEETGAGTLSTKCHKCQASGYAKAGTGKKRKILAVMRPDADAEPASAPDHKPPAAKKTTSVFNPGL